MDSNDGADRFFAAPARPDIERDAFDRDRESERASINREKEELKKQKHETSQMKQHLMFGISEFFWKKAELESGLVHAPEFLDDDRLPAPPPLQPESDTDSQLQSPPRKKKRGRPRLDKQPVSPITAGEKTPGGIRPPSTVSPANFADDEGEETDRPRLVPKRGRGRPRLDQKVETAEADKQDSAVEASSNSAKKRGRPKLYHDTGYGTRLPLTYLLPSGATIEAEEARLARPAHWKYVIRFIKDRQAAAKFRLRDWLEGKSKECMVCFVDLGMKSLWTPGCERVRACGECQRLGTPCLVLDPTGSKMVLLPRSHEFAEAS
ncbi:uncharacterized protein BKCO1_1700037 [Diplodia corticola]|uniref:Uncharacterized protein n=1 Tax=Diplodia corticola TaxID=236234 RepID=A0A1J9R223_9PEZI|nr:uncharacterized protein BKCO1_1700037 [Diplodia corticola]OJD35446.1 hypothetical protein BKCO1_1700037 [Diplodia corticola]